MRRHLWIPLVLLFGIALTFSGCRENDSVHGLLVVDNTSNQSLQVEVQQLGNTIPNGNITLAPNQANGAIELRKGSYTVVDTTNSNSHIVFIKGGETTPLSLP